LLQLFLFVALLGMVLDSLLVKTLAQNSVYFGNRALVSELKEVAEFRNTSRPNEQSKEEAALPDACSRTPGSASRR
jgi:hypothetical protein